MLAAWTSAHFMIASKLLLAAAQLMRLPDQAVAESLRQVRRSRQQHPAHRSTHSMGEGFTNATVSTCCQMHFATASVEK